MRKPAASAKRCSPSPSNFPIAYAGISRTVKHHVWQVTGANENALWLGPAEPHSASMVLATVDPKDPCTCGRPRHFGQCCKSTYERAIGSLWKRQSRGSPHDFPPSEGVESISLNECSVPKTSRHSEPVVVDSARAIRLVPAAPKSHDCGTLSHSRRLHPR